MTGDRASFALRQRERETSGNEAGMMLNGELSVSTFCFEKKKTWTKFNGDPNQFFLPNSK